MSKLYYGSICYTDLLDALKQAHSSGVKATNGKIYVNINVWINDKKDDYGNSASIQLNPKQDSGHEKLYIGNLKESEKKDPTPITAADISSTAGEEDDLPF
ncbi:hypothetical protein D3C72_875850 [compost metagenome]